MQTHDFVTKTEDGRGSGGSEGAKWGPKVRKLKLKGSEGPKLRSESPKRMPNRGPKVRTFWSQRVRRPQIGVRRSENLSEGPNIGSKMGTDREYPPISGGFFRVIL